MSKFQEVFGTRKAFIPVVHVLAVDQALIQTRVAAENGADGVFLIDHRVGGNHLLNVYQQVREEFKDFWLGLNLLDLSPRDALVCVPETASGLWVDDAGYKESTLTDSLHRLKTHAQWRLSKKWQGLYFGGVAFKYKEKVRDLELAVRTCAPYVDVLTTSGDRTGDPPSIEKARLIRRATGGPTAVASGMTPDNVEEYVPFFDAFLVATGISLDEHSLDWRLVRQFAETLRRAQL